MAFNASSWKSMLLSGLGILIFGLGSALLAHSRFLFLWLGGGCALGMLGLRFWLMRRPYRIEISAQDTSSAPPMTASDHLSSKFLANISHECRTPLSTVIGYAECMLRGYDGAITEEQRKDLEAIIRSARDLLRMLEDVLQLAKVESGRIDLDLQPFPLEECVRSVIESLQNEADQRHLKLEVHIQEDLPPLLGDPVKVRRILLNLVQNAIKYTMEGAVRISATAAPPYAEIVVEDTGVGISPAELKRIFEPFYQGGIGKSGVGLGLSIVKRLVDSHAGSIEVESQVGKGTRFIVRLPLAIPELKAQIRQLLDQKLEPSRRAIAYRLYQWLDASREQNLCQEANEPS